jgi:hypothetical protein
MRKLSLNDFNPGNNSLTADSFFDENQSETIYVWVCLNGVKLFVPQWENRGVCALQNRKHQLNKRRK